MKKLILSLLFGASCLFASAISVYFPDDFADGWDAYVGKTVTFENNFVVCGISTMATVYISHRRLRIPEENAEGLAQGDSTEYYSIESKNNRYLITLSNLGKAYLNPETIRKGAIIKGLTAYVSGANSLSFTSWESCNAEFPTVRPDLGNPRLVVCGANIENYWTTFGKNGAKNEEQFEQQNTKIVAGLRNMDADIYAICELQQGTSAISTLTARLNAAAGADIYSYVDNGFKEYESVSTGFIYRNDKVTPYGTMQFPYSSTYTTYHYRMMVKGFEENATGAKFAISLNHFLSKVSGSAESNPTRMENAQNLVSCLNKIVKNKTFDDEDILILGDFNCYTQEQPIRYIVSSGFTDQLMRFDSLGYSYSYSDNTVGYLDRCFSTPSMNDQITAVHPYHINADYFYRLEYKYGNYPSMYRYADHDPILVGLNLSGGTDMESVPAEQDNAPRKFIRNGQIFIERNGVIYTILGATTR